jgi:hypothetical protein
MSVPSGLETLNGVRVWRIENKILVDVPVESYGSFYGGDWYVIFADRITQQLHCLTGH